MAEVQPRLRQAEYLFCRFPVGKRLPEAVLALATFEDADGTTAIVERARAERAGIEGAGPYAMLTLEGEGAGANPALVAGIVHELGEHGIPASAVAAYQRDHLFVPAARGEDALAVVEALVENPSD